MPQRTTEVKNIAPPPRLLGVVLNELSTETDLPCLSLLKKLRLCKI
jgi:hypothetical protein